MEFGDIREKIDNLIDEGKVCVKKKSILESRKRLEKAEEFFKLLKEKTQGDFQQKIITRMRHDLDILSNDIDDLLSKREAGKKEDGNIAFKCNWNDKGYKEICSIDAYTYNLVVGSSWCNSPDCDCQNFKGIATAERQPCYESIALKELFFGAGWDHTGGEVRKRKLHHVREGRMALLTTRLPFSDEKDRIIISCLLIDRVEDDPGEETKVYGNKDKSIIIDYDKYKFRFWDFYKNPNAPEVIFWGSGLVRYITDESVLNILKSIGERYRNDALDVSVIIDLIKHYEDIISKKNERRGVTYEKGCQVVLLL
jgi:hypothetical protein